jgi:hypothetical protein
MPISVYCHQLEPGMGPAHSLRSLLNVVVAFGSQEIDGARCYGTLHDVGVHSILIIQYLFLIWAFK